MSFNTIIKGGDFASSQALATGLKRVTENATEAQRKTVGAGKQYYVASWHELSQDQVAQAMKLEQSSYNNQQQIQDLIIIEKKTVEIDHAMSEIIKIASEALEMAQVRFNFALDTKQSVASRQSQIDHLLGALEKVLNTRGSDSYLFSGARFNTPAVNTLKSSNIVSYDPNDINKEIISDSYYNGDNAATLEYSLADGQQIKISFNAADQDIKDTIAGLHYLKNAGQALMKADAIAQARYDKLMTKAESLLHKSINGLTESKSNIALALKQIKQSHNQSQAALAADTESLSMIRAVSAVDAQQALVKTKDALDVAVATHSFLQKATSPLLRALTEH